MTQEILQQLVLPRRQLHLAIAARHLARAVRTLSPARPVWRQRAARVVSQEAVGPDHLRLALDVPLPFAAAVPGQFVQLRLPAPTAS